MGILHRVYARAASDVWHTEGKLLEAMSLVRRPVAAQWLVTAACDLHCPHCYSAAGRRAPDELRTDEAKHLLVDELVALGVPLLVLAGGELLLRRDIPELVAYACERGLGWAMHTHGGHVARFEELFRRHPPVLAAISLDGDRSFHDAFRGKAGSFDAALQAVDVLRRAGCSEVVLGTTITRDNADRVADLVPIVARSGAHSWGLHLFSPEGRGHDHRDLFPTPRQLRRVASFARRTRALLRVELCNEWGSAGVDDLLYRDQPFSCGAGRSSFVVSATGDVLPCTTTDPREREGNLRDTPLREIWVNAFSRFRAGRDRTCDERGECWLQTRNGVGCSEDAFGAAARPRSLWIDRLPVLQRAASDAPRAPIRPGRAGLAGERATRAARLAAVGLVFLQGCVERPPQPPTATGGDADGPKPAGDRSTSHEPIEVVEEFPAVLAGAPEIHFAMRDGGWSEFMHALAICATDPGACDTARRHTAWDAASAPERSAALAELALAHIGRLEAGEPDTWSQLLALLDASELLPIYDAWWAGHLWRRARALAVDDERASLARTQLLARLHQHLRVTQALSRAEATLGPVQMRPWLKKSGPPPGASRMEVPAGFTEAAREAYAKADAGEWDVFGQSMRVHLGQAGARVELARAGRVERLRDGARLTLRRLDVLRAHDPVELRIDGGSAVGLVAGEELTLFELAERLDAATRERIRVDVEKAAAGDADALARVEARLPLAHALVRDAVEGVTMAPGAPALRLLLTAFDE